MHHHTPTHLQGAAKEGLLSGQVPGDRADSAGKRPEEVRQELVLVVDVREVALAREDVERRHHVVLAVSAEPAGCRYAHVRCYMMWHAYCRISVFYAVGRVRDGMDVFAWMSGQGGQKCTHMHGCV